MSNAIESQIKNRIAEFVEELDLLVRKNTLDALQGALERRAAPARRGRPAGTKRGPGRPKGSGDVEDAAAKIVAHVRANDGLGISAIADATGVALPVAKKAAIKLLAEGALEKSGQKRGTVYHVGSGRPARAKAGKRRGRKARKKPAVRKATKAKRRKPTARKATKASRRAKTKRAAPRSAKKAVVIPARKRHASAPKLVSASPVATTDVPHALAVAE